SRSGHEQQCDADYSHSPGRSKCSRYDRKHSDTSSDEGYFLLSSPQRCCCRPDRTEVPAWHLPVSTHASPRFPGQTCSYESSDSCVSQEIRSDECRLRAGRVSATNTKIVLLMRLI